MRCFSVYIMSSWSRCLYVGVSNDLVRRVGEHKGRLPCAKGFAARYRTHRLVYFETGSDVYAALSREHELKGWSRGKKVALVSRHNATWRDLAARWPDIDALDRVD
jgi:putative endonuclease